MAEGNQHIESQSERFSKRVMRHFRSNRLAMWATRFILALSVVALLADFIANEKPIMASYHDTTYFPVLRGYAVDLGLAGWPEELRNVEWKALEYDWVVWPLVPYLPRNTDYANANFVGPFDTQNVPSTKWRHWLGTDKLGHDVFAALVHGTRIALVVGIIAMGIAALLGILFGALAGYFGDTRLRLTRAQIGCNAVFALLGLYYGIGVRGYALAEAYGWAFFGQLLISLLIVAAILALGNGLAKLLHRLPWLAKPIVVPVDMLISRTIEIVVSIPTLFLIIALVAISERSILTVMVVIGLTSWTGVARYIRGELLKVRSMQFVEAAHAMGFSDLRIMLVHAIPNALSPVLVALAFGIAGSILTEATLSFIGIGVPAETFTWGKLLSVARGHSEAWWLTILPGLAIFVTVTLFNLAGDGLSDALDPKRAQVSRSKKRAEG